MGIVAHPEPKYQFEGKTMLKCISKIHNTRHKSFNKKLTNDYYINDLIEHGHWKSLVPESPFPYVDTNILIADLIQLMQDTYHFDNDIKSQITFCYRTWPMKVVGKASKPICITNPHQYLLKDLKCRVTPNGPIRNVTLDDMFIRIQIPEGAFIHDDCSCDLEFMMLVVDEIGDSIQKSFHWVKKGVPIHLFMDNISSHGTIDCKEEFVKTLKEKYNVVVVWQVPRSPETNLLDLGVWMSFQSLVERLHRFQLMEPNVLNRTVMKAWIVYSGYTKLKEVDDRWKEVLALIIKDDGSNALVETCWKMEAKQEVLPPIFAEIEMNDNLDCEDEENVMTLVNGEDDD